MLTITAEDRARVEAVTDDLVLAWSRGSQDGISKGFDQLFELGLLKALAAPTSYAGIRVYTDTDEHGDWVTQVVRDQSGWPTVLLSAISLNREQAAKTHREAIALVDRVGPSEVYRYNRYPADFWCRELPKAEPKFCSLEDEDDSFWDPGTQPMPPAGAQ